MGIEISGNRGRPPQELIDAAKTQAANSTYNASGKTASTNTGNGSPSSQVNLSSTASQLQALESQIANLPVVDTQRVQEVQRTLATGSFEVEPARVADKVLTFEAGLGPSSASA